MEHMNGNGKHSDLNGHQDPTQLNGNIYNHSQENHAHGSGDFVEAVYSERYTVFGEMNGKFQNVVKEHRLVTDKRLPKLGVMLVGLGGNNGSTLVAGVLANKNKIQWETKNGSVSANYFGSFTQSATCHAGFKVDSSSGHLEDVYLPVKDLLPTVCPNDFVISGWDINSANLYDSCKRSKVLEPDLLRQLKPELERIVPLPGALNQDYIASNQAERADNVLLGTN